MHVMESFQVAMSILWYLLQWQLHLQKFFGMKTAVWWNLLERQQHLGWHLLEWRRQFSFQSFGVSNDICLSNLFHQTSVLHLKKFQILLLAWRLHSFGRSFHWKKFQKMLLPFKRFYQMLFSFQKIPTACFWNSKRIHQTVSDEIFWKGNCIFWNSKRMKTASDGIFWKGFYQTASFGIFWNENCQKMELLLERHSASFAVFIWNKNYVWWNLLERQVHLLEFFGMKTVSDGIFWKGNSSFHSKLFGIPKDAVGIFWNEDGILWNLLGWQLHLLDSFGMDCIFWNFLEWKLSLMESFGKATASFAIFWNETCVWWNLLERQLHLLEFFGMKTVSYGMQLERQQHSFRN